MNLNALLDPLAIALFAMFVLVWPVSGVLDYRRLIRRTEENIPDARLRFYRLMIVWEWASLTVFLAWWFWAGLGAARLGLVANPSGSQWRTIGIGIGLCALFVVQMVGTTRSPKSLAKIRRNLGNLEAMSPRNPRELRGFDLLSITVGICEEILYRGMIFAVLTPAIGTWPAVVVSCVIFGLAHIYQGPLGFLKTAMIGGAFALLTVFSGSLYIAIIVHIVMDMTIGRIMTAAVALPEEATASEEVSAAQ